MFDAIFEALFSYRPVVFREGEFRFDLSAASLAASVLVVAAVALAVATYRGVRIADGRTRDRIVLTTLRVAVFGLVLFCLLRPTLIVRAAVEQQNVIAVLLDDSRSMQIPDWDGQPRAAFVREQFAAGDGPLLEALASRFVVRTFRFSSSAARAASGDTLDFAGSQTRLGAALDGVREEMAGLPVAGIVLVSDGADTGDSGLDETLLGLKAEKLPVFTVGVGSESLPRDVQIDRVSTPRTVLKGASLLVDLVVRQTGYSGQTITVDVEDEGRIVGSQQTRLPSDGSPASVRIRATADEAGPRLFSFRVTPLEGELVAQNNVREALVDVRDERERILYFEGEPRWEMKFLKRAVADDENLELVALQRTADNKYMRIFGDEPDDPEQLVGGFPQTREELFRYRALILGSVEAGVFSGDQLQMIADFVDRRGGGLLMLGGARSFGEGGYGGTPVADALPLIIDPRRRASEPSGLVRLKIAPSRAGQGHAVTQIAETEAASIARWADLPLVTTVNEALDAKPAATVLLNGTDEGGREQVVLASQRYGRGKAAALTLQDTWQWQMHVSIPLEDQTHEHYWRQLMRWLVEGVPEVVDVRTPDRVEPGDIVTIDTTIVDPRFVELNDATVVAQVVRPSGATMTVPLQWTGDRDGEYSGTFVSAESGAYEVNVDASRAGGERVGTGGAYVRVGPGDAEFFDPTMHAAPLRRIAEETGGRFYTTATAQGLAEDVRYAGRGVTSVEERELWNMPILLLGLFALVCAEWGYRRAVGLA
jgi:uncharacterized membrane protein